MTRARAETKIEREPEADGDKSNPLQDAQWAWQIAIDHLIGERRQQYGADSNQAEGIETDRNERRHRVALQHDVDAAGGVNFEQHQHDGQATGPQSNRQRAPAGPCGDKAAEQNKERDAHHAVQYDKFFDSPSTPYFVASANARK
jgi:hypothetical protein